MAQIEDNLNLEETLSVFFALKPLSLNLILLTSLLKMQHLQFRSVSWCRYVALAMLILSTVLQVAVMWRGGQVRWRCHIAYLWTVLQMVAAASLLLFLGKAHTVVVVPLLLMVLTLVSYFWWKTFIEATRVVGYGWEEFKEQLKRQFDMSAEVVSLAFAGLIGTVLGYVKGPAHQMTGGYMAPECFLLHAAVFGLLVMLLCTVPLYVVTVWNTKRMAMAYLPILAYVSLFFLVLAGVMAAEEILQQHVFLVCFAFVLLAMACFVEEIYYNNTPPISAAGGQEIYQYLLATYFLSCFAALMATRLKYSTRSGAAVSTSWGLKGFVLSALCGILAYAVRMVVFTGLPGMKFSPFTKKVFILGICLSFTGTVVSTVVVVRLHPDEFQNII